MSESDESNVPPFIGLAQPLPEVLPQKPDWDAALEAMRWLNDIEAMQGGRNGPTIKLRAAIKAMQTKVHLADEFLTEIERNLPDYAPADSPAEVICDLINERDEARAEAAALREDAERYRHIRQHVHGENYGLTSQCFVFDWPTPLSNILRGSVAQHLDAAIDAARKESGNG